MLNAKKAATAKPIRTRRRAVRWTAAAAFPRTIHLPRSRRAIDD
jgi:hypothetical protein